VLVADGVTLADWCVATFGAPDRDAATLDALRAVVTAFLADGGGLAAATASLEGALTVATTAGLGGR
jgi:hypothetical protein